MRKHYLSAIANSVLVLVLTALLAVAHADEALERIQAALSPLVADLKADQITPTPVPDLYEVALGTHLVYVTGDGRYLLQGKILDLQTRERITENREQQLKHAVLQGLDEKDMIVYGDEDLPHTVTVFTDIDCGYCRKLHDQIGEYNKEGIRIRYLAYPRAGPGSPSERAAMAVWCSDDPREAMTKAKGGQSVPYRECDNPVREQYKLGQDFGISGTPALLLEDGDLVPGYVPPKRLRAVLDQLTNKPGN